MDDELINLLRAVANGFHMRMQAAVAASGEGLPEFQARLINLIGRNEGISQQALAALTERDKAQIARAIKELEAHGHVSRHAHASDWRTQCLALTAKGREAHARLNAIRRKLGTAVLASLSEQEKQALKAQLSKVRATLEDQTPCTTSPSSASAVHPANRHPSTATGNDMSDQSPQTSQPDRAADRRPQRIRHELRFRLLEVQRVEQLTPHIMRVALGGSELEGFHSPGFDDHIKLFIPAPGQTAPSLPVLGEGGMSFPDGQPRPATRDFTPRRYDPVAGVLELDFALHDSGPASDWARQAAPGQKLGIGGPRGSFMLPTNFDWHLLIGDETALPAIARRLEELPAGARAIVLAEVEDEEGRIAFTTEADATIYWAYRRDGDPQADPLVSALQSITLPQGDFHGWIACESSTAKRLRQMLIEDHGANPKWIRASGYWRRGAAGVHDSFDEKDKG